MKVVVTGAAGSIGSRLCRRLAAEGVSVVAVDRDRFDWPGVDDRVVDLATAKLTPLLVGADALVHLGSPFPPDAATLDASAASLRIAERVFAAARDAAVSHIVVMSTAMVYGAWPNNPIPLTEQAPVRPNPNFAFAMHHAELERRAFEWRAMYPASTLTILRPAVLVADEQPSRVARLLRSVATVRSQDGDAPAQYLHIDDLVDAVAIALRSRTDGVLNVAPEGWIPPESLGQLAYPGPRPRLPMWMANALAQLRWRSGLAAAPPGLVPYTVHPWVVSSDRMRALGWAPRNTNEEAYVLGHQAKPLDKLNAHRRQQIALGVTGGVLAAIAAAVVAAVVRHRRLKARG